MTPRDGRGRALEKTAPTGRIRPWTAGVTGAFGETRDKIGR